MRTALLACAPIPVQTPGTPAPAVRSPARATGGVAAPPAAPAPRPATPAPAPRSRKAFWAFALLMVVAVGGGGAITMLARRNVAERQGHPDTVPPAAAQGASPAPQAPTPTGTLDAARPERGGSAATATETPTPTPTGTTTGTTTAPATGTRPVTTKADRELAQGLYRKAEARRAAQDVDGAIRLYLRAEAADPALAEVQKKLALCYQLKGDTRRAAERYRRYLATRPPDAAKVRAILETLR
jgi:hypothetical protein